MATKKNVLFLLLWIYFVVTVGCLILHQRYRKRYNQYMNMANEVATTSINAEVITSDNESNDENLIGNGSPTVARPHSCGNLPTISEGIFIFYVHISLSKYLFFFFYRLLRRYAKSCRRYRGSGSESFESY